MNSSAWKLWRISGGLSGSQIDQGTSHRTDDAERQVRQGRTGAAQGTGDFIQMAGYRKAIGRAQTYLRRRHAARFEQSYPPAVVRSDPPAYRRWPGMEDHRPPPHR